MIPDTGRLYSMSAQLRGWLLPSNVKGNVSQRTTKIQTDYFPVYIQRYMNKPF